MEKETIVETVSLIPRHTVNLENGEYLTRDPNWTPGFVARFPWMGLCGLFTVLLCSVGSIVTLVTSNGASQTQWPSQVAPNVLINIMNSVANMAFAVAIGNGIAIAWWRQALKGASIKQLHRSWAFSTSVKDVLLGLRYFNVVALGALIAKCTVIDSTLMQKATDTTTMLDTNVYTRNMTGLANLTFPITGKVGQQHYSDPGLMTTLVNNDIKVWSQSGGFLPNRFTGCEGLCFLNVTAMGFAFNCSDPMTRSVNYGVQLMKNETAYGKGSVGAAALDATIFNIAFTAVDYSHLESYSATGPEYSYLQMDLLYTQSTAKGPVSCPGHVTKQTCELRPALVSYPVQVEQYSNLHSTDGVRLGPTQKSFLNGTTGVAVAPFNRTLMQQDGYEIKNYIKIEEEHEFLGDPTRSHLAGIQLALSTYLGGSVSLFPDVGWGISQSGNAMQYLTNSPPHSRCSLWYRDPMTPDTGSGVPSIVQRINEIMFSIATSVSLEQNGLDVTDIHNYTANSYLDTVHYVSHFPYMWGALASTLTCVLLVIPLYWGFWELGRKVTLGPLEIAHAFRSPMTAEASNTDLNDLLREVGDRQVKYGQILEGDGRGSMGVAEPGNVAGLRPDGHAGGVDIHGSVIEMFTPKRAVTR